MSASETPTPPNQPASVARQAGQENSRAVGETKRFYPKTHANFWKSKLEHRTYSHDGKMCEVPEWSVRIQFKCIRRSFDLETANKEEAAAKARDIYLSLVAKGWSATLAELAPQSETPVNVTEGNPTVGEFLAEVERTSTLKPKTFHRYAQYFRMMAAQIQGVKSDRSRYNLNKTKKPTPNASNPTTVKPTPPISHNHPRSSRRRRTSRIVPVMAETIAVRPKTATTYGVGSK
jgi:hypothetical protein